MEGVMLERHKIITFLSLIVILFAFGACIDLEPDTAITRVGKEYTTTATVERQEGPIEGAFLTFEIISGPNAGKMSEPNSGECIPDDCMTDSIGEVKWTYTSSKPGTDLIVASTIDEDQMLIESDPVENTWILPIPTLSQWGLIALVGILGIVGLIVIKRRKATA